MSIARRVLSNVLTVNPSKTKLMVFDMAGTTVNEHGIVYETLYDVIKANNITIKEEEIQRWHGINKYEVIKHFVTKHYTSDMRIENIMIIINHQFNNLIMKRYFAYNTRIDLIHPELPNTFENLRMNGIKIALNTGYPINIQESIINKLNMNQFIDGYISSEEVSHGRPYPYMINSLMDRFNIQNSQEVIKVGDTPSDIEEGKNANCYLSIGVLSGASTEDILEKADADYIIQDISRITTV